MSEESEESEEKELYEGHLTRRSFIGGALGTVGGAAAMAAAVSPLRDFDMSDLTLEKFLQQRLRICSIDRHGAIECKRCVEIPTQRKIHRRHGDLDGPFGTDQHLFDFTVSDTSLQQIGGDDQSPFVQIPDKLYMRGGGLQ